MGPCNWTVGGLTWRWPTDQRSVGRGGGRAAPACASAAPRQPAAGMANWQALLSLVALNKLCNAIGALHCCPRASSLLYLLLGVHSLVPGHENMMKWHSAAIRSGRHAGESVVVRALGGRRRRRQRPARLPSLVLIAQLPPGALPLSTSSAAVGWRAGSRFPAPVVPVSLRRNERIRALRYGASLSTNRQKNRAGQEQRGRQFWPGGCCCTPSPRRWGRDKGPDK
jgi:hypothetical protein